MEEKEYRKLIATRITKYFSIVPMIVRVRIKALAKKYGYENLYNVLEYLFEECDFERQLSNKDRFKDDIHKWWYIDKVLISYLDCIEDDIFSEQQ